MYKIVRLSFSLLVIFFASLSLAKSIIKSDQTTKEILIEPETTVLLAPELTVLEPEYKYYDVEIILFKHNNPLAINSEYWQPIDDFSDEVDNESTDNLEAEVNTARGIQLESENLVELADKEQVVTKMADYFVSDKHFVAIDEHVSLIDKASRFLNETADYLKYSKDYQVLVHLAWKQPGYNKDQALPVEFIFDREKKNITGSIKVVLARYLHTQVDFNLIQKVCREVAVDAQQVQGFDQVKIEVQTTNQELNSKAEQSVEQEINTDLATSIAPEMACQMEKIQFKQSRKMRSKKLHYLDHPIFGLLVQINPSEVNQLEVPIEAVKP